MKAPRKFLGAILAGGSSTRFGSDKAFAPIDGLPAWERQRQLLSAAGCDAVVLIRRPGQIAPLGIGCWRDNFSEIGPIAGLHAALQQCPVEFLAVLAVDMPLVSASWFERLRNDCTGGIGVVAQHEEVFEPLAAIYPREALGVVKSQIELRRYSLQALARVLHREGKMRILNLDAAEVAMLQSRNERPS